MDYMYSLWYRLLKCEKKFRNLNSIINVNWAKQLRTESSICKEEPKLRNNKGIFRNGKINHTWMEAEAAYNSCLGITNSPPCTQINTTESSLLEKINSCKLLLESCIMSSYFESPISDCRDASILHTLWPCRCSTDMVVVHDARMLFGIQTYKMTQG